MPAAYTFYGNFLSSHCYKVGLMLALCGEKFDYRHVDLAKKQQKSPEFLAINRFGQVPAMVHNGFNLCQSDTILQYLAEQTGKFGGATPKERQRIREWLAWEADRLEPGVGRTRLYERFAKPDAAVIDYMRDAAEAGLDQLNDLLEGRRFLVGDRPTIADIGVFGAIAHMAEGKLDRNNWPNISAWWDRIVALPGFQWPYDLLPKTDRDAD
jgi:glutathione S-transferase